MSPAIYQQYFAAIANQSKDKPQDPARVPQTPKAKKAEESLFPLLKKGKRNALG